MRKRGTSSMHCEECGDKLIKSKELILVNNKAYAINVDKCVKCGESTNDLFELERIRKEIYPSFLKRIKSFFISKNIELLNFSSSKGKIL
ncbi:MAG: hypothetical protein KKD48_04200 [Nanoarchaeota archaeon]|nr:hypothetical protein [Nanoarchaeota archaeon]